MQARETPKTPCHTRQRSAHHRRTWHLYGGHVERLPSRTHGAIGRTAHSSMNSHTAHSTMVPHTAKRVLRWTVWFRVSAGRPFCGRVRKVELMGSASTDDARERERATETVGYHLKRLKKPVTPAASLWVHLNEQGQGGLYRCLQAKCSGKRAEVAHETQHKDTSHNFLLVTVAANWLNTSA
jgi:hypothetical protein